MTLRRRIILIIVVALVVLLGLMYGLQHAIVLDGFHRLERREMTRNVENTRRAIEREVEHLDTLTRDWAAWDDTYQFMLDRNGNFRQSSLGHEALVDAKINLLWIADTQKRTVVFETLDVNTRQEIDLSDVANDALDMQMLSRAASAAGARGVVLVSQGALLLASRPILSTTGEGPARGILLMGRLLDESLLQELDDTMQLHLQVLRADAVGLPDDFQQALPALRAGQLVHVRALDAQTVAGYAWLYAMDGHPALILRVDAPRDTYRFGAVNFAALIAATCILLPLFCGALLWAMERQVLTRVYDLAGQVDRLGKSGDLTLRVQTVEQNELGTLAQNINRMLDGLQAADESTRRREHYLEGLAKAAQALLPPSGPIPYQTWLAALGRSAEASRAYVFLNHRRADGELLMSQIAEWCAPGVEPQIDNPRMQDLSYIEAGLRRFLDQLSSGQVINALACDLLPSERALLEEQNIQTILLLPLLMDGLFMGFIGLDMCAEARLWSASEVDLLKVAAADLVQALKHRRDEKVQLATYRISQAVHSVENLAELFHAIHRIVGELMPANNFYIALYDEQTKLLQFPYFVDEVDQPPESKPLGHGITEYVLRTGEPLLADPPGFARMAEQGLVDSIGAPSIDWLGVPLKWQGQTFGVLVVQTYTEGVRYSEQEKDILIFVSTQVAMAIARKRAEEALRQSEERYRTIFETTGAATIIVEEDMSISLANRRFAELSGCSHEELQSRPSWPRFVCAEDRPRMMEYHRLRRVDQDLAPGAYEFVFVDHWGVCKNVFMTVGLIPGTTSSVASLIDITDRKLAEEARAKLETQLRQAQKMEAIGMLAGGVAHDFNNLLTVILGNSELGLSSAPPDAPLYKELSTIQRAALRGAKLTQQLLSFSRRQVLEMQSLDINAHITEFSAMLIRLIGVDVELRLELSPDSLLVYGDAGALDQVLMNLGVNARDAMPVGGVLTIGTQHVTPDAATLRAHVRTQGNGTGEYVCLSVIDNGVGMDEAAQAHLFEPFYTTKEVGKGTGLGLSVVYGIVEQHKGWIAVHSEPGKGTRFDIYLPLSDEVREG